MCKTTNPPRACINPPKNLESNSDHFCFAVLFLTVPLKVEPLIGLRFSMYAQKENLSCPHGKLLIRLCGNKKRQNEAKMWD